MALKIDNKKDFYGVAVVMLFVFLMTFYPFVPRVDELIETTGKVERIYKSRADRFKYNNVKINSSSAISEFKVDSICNLSRIKQGEFIEAKVQRDVLGRDIYWVWELYVDGNRLLTYEQMVERAESDIAPIRWGSIAIFLACGVTGMFIRR